MSTPDEPEDALYDVDAELIDAENVAVSAIRLMNRAGAERDALQARIDAALRAIGYMFMEPIDVGEVDLRHIREALIGEAVAGD
jgi:hypothetical protein